MLFIFSTDTFFACDNSSIVITSSVTNADGSITYNIELGIDHGGLDATYYGYVLEFNSSLNTPTVILGGTYPTTNSVAPGDVTCGNLTETFQALSGNDINSLNNDSDWNQFMGLSNVLSFETGAIWGAITNDICIPIQVTVSGCVEEIVFHANANSGAAACVYTISTGQSCANCEITNLSATQGPCDPLTNTYTAEITVTYSNAPGSGTLDVNGQSFSITSSPQTVILAGLVSDGNSVDVTANFSADPTCTFTTNGLFTAPLPCSCSITNVTATQGPCDPSTNTYSAEIIVTYSGAPGSGTLDVNGQSFSITSSPQTVLLTGLVSDGNSVDVTANFSADPACTLTTNGLFTAPPPCSCSITNIAASQGPCDPATNTYSAEITVTYSGAPGSGTLDVNGQSFSITSSPQTITLTGLVANGNSVDINASFSDAPACLLISNSLYNAPNGCSCDADAGTISQ